MRITIKTQEVEYQIQKSMNINRNIYFYDFYSTNIHLIAFSPFLKNKIETYKNNI